MPAHRLHGYHARERGILPAPLVYTAGDADAPRVMLFTGGSTGKPKLWSKTARNLFGEAQLLAETFGIGPR